MIEDGDLVGDGLPGGESPSLGGCLAWILVAAGHALLWVLIVFAILKLSPVGG